MTVSFTAPRNRDRSRDWIGLYESGASNRSYEAYKYTSGDRTGFVTFRIDEPGTYEFRYLLNNGYTSVEETGEVVVTSPARTCPVDNLSAVTNYPAQSGPVVAFGDSLTVGVGATNN